MKTLKINSCHKKWIFLLFLMTVYSSVFAQSTPDVSKKEQESPTKPETPQKETVKVVPAAKSQNAKPVRVDQAKAKGARPSARPARSPRPATRTVRPGRGM